jgi:hypothetical protein
MKNDAIRWFIFIALVGTFAGASRVQWVLLSPMRRRWRGTIEGGGVSGAVGYGAGIVEAVGVQRADLGHPAVHHAAGD